MKNYILDTNVLLHDPKSIFRFEDNNVIIPLVVLDELDGKKNGIDEVARNARTVIRSLDGLRSLGSINEGVLLENGGILKVELNHKSFLPDDLDPNKADNRIISVALGYKSEGVGEVIVVSKDLNLRIKCDALKVKAEDYDSDSVAPNANLIYSGTNELFVESDVIDELYAKGRVKTNEQLYENQYVSLVSLTNPQHSGIARFENGSLVKIPTAKTIWGVSPRNREQLFAFDALFNPNIKLVSLTGPSGTGKTLMAAAAGLSQVIDKEKGSYDRMLISRPIVPLGKDIGFLPGSADEKMSPWIAPLQDNMDLLFSEKGRNFQDMCKTQGLIKVEALTYIRGRSIPKSFICIDEAQQLTKHEIKTIVTRIGEGSKLVFTGDILQIDTPYLDALDNGLSYIIEKFKKYSIAAHVTLTKGERSELATLASEIL